jgi:hypothetical protein
MAEQIKDQSIDEKEMDAAMEEAEKTSKTARTVKLKHPLEYNGVTYTELHFDFDKLRGKDSLEVEAEIERTTGISVVVPAINAEFQTRIAARACEEPIGRDALLNMNLFDYNGIRNMARNFMLRSDR